MDATVHQITHRRAEVVQHQKVLKDLHAKLSDAQAKELADWENSAEGQAVVSAESAS